MLGLLAFLLVTGNPLASTPSAVTIGEDAEVATSACHFSDDSDALPGPDANTHIVARVTCDQPFEIILVDKVSGYPRDHSYLYHSDQPESDLELRFSIPTIRAENYDLKIVPLQ